MENENLQEFTSETLENEEVFEENVSDTQHSDLSVEGDTPLTDNIETERTFTQSELEEIVTAVLSNDSETYSSETQSETFEVPRTLFNTPLDEFTVSEGLLVCIFLLLLANFINSIFKGSHWFGKL